MKGLAVQATASRGCSECSRARTRELTGIRAACVGEHRCWWDLRRIPETQVPRSCTFSGARGGGGSLSDSVQKRTDAGFAHLVHFDCAPRVRNVLQDPLGEIRKRNSGAFRFELVCAKLRARAIREHVLDPLDRALTILHQFRSIAAVDGVFGDLSELCRYPDSQF